MPTTTRVAVSLPAALVRRIDALGRNRSRFVQKAVAREMAAHSHNDLLAAVESPHPDGLGLAESGLADWASAVPDGDQDLVDSNKGTAVTWTPGKGWLEKASTRGYGSR
ncbi:MAG: hypothetical protein ACXWLS_01735 [Myxococcaceae bacterium]